MGRGWGRVCVLGSSYSARRQLVPQGKIAGFPISEAVRKSRGRQSPTLSLERSSCSCRCFGLVVSVGSDGLTAPKLGGGGRGWHRKRSGAAWVVWEFSVTGKGDPQKSFASVVYKTQKTQIPWPQLRTAESEGPGVRWDFGK